MRWIGTLGGPLVVLPLGYVGLWTGASGPYGEEEAAQAVLDVLVSGSTTTAEVVRARGVKRAATGG